MTTTIELNCPYCESMVEIPTEDGGPMAGENLICGVCEKVFILGERPPAEDEGRSNSRSRSDTTNRRASRETLSRIGAKIGELLWGAVIGIAAVTFAVTMFLFGWAYGDAVINSVRWLLN